MNISISQVYSKNIRSTHYTLVENFGFSRDTSCTYVESLSRSKKGNTLAPRYKYTIAAMILLSRELEANRSIHSECRGLSRRAIYDEALSIIILYRSRLSGRIRRGANLDSLITVVNKCRRIHLKVKNELQTEKNSFSATLVYYVYHYTYEYDILIST